MIICFNSHSDRDDDSLLTVDQEFDTVSGFLLKRTKDMVNKYRQLLVREAQVRLHQIQTSLSSGLRGVCVFNGGI